MLLSELVAEVYIQTERSDLVADTSSAIRAATLTVHNSDYYNRDVLESGLKFDSSTYEQRAELNAIPRYRKMKWLRKWDYVNNCGGAVIDIVDSPDVFDEYNRQRTNIGYEAGAVFNIRSNTQEQYYLFGAYVHPDVTSLNFNSWIADGS
jgi:hypothetical protein